ncbi:G-protein coupled receptor family C group 6 member A-like [Sardina pilchardus]|uniref:G-protein coupled receptor family C group 6 member A-like n=1 Tax=Sardina pilchardus TaxID=27697 RepID=UPI002E156E10
MVMKEGDIIIGGLFPIHESVNIREGEDGRPSERNCTRYSVARLLQALMLVEAVEAVNRSPLLGNLTLGYHVVDSCSDVTTAVAVTHRYLDDFNSVCPENEERPHRSGNESMLENHENMPDRNASMSENHESMSENHESMSENHESMSENHASMSESHESNLGPGHFRPANVLVGGYHSEISIAVARQLSIKQIPQISYGSTTGILSDKSRFPAFMRTVPEDNFQAQAIVDILVGHKWTWVGLVTTDGDYGRYAAQRFQLHAERQGICISFSVVLPDILDDAVLEDGIGRTVRHLEEDPKVRAVVSFAKPDHMMYIMERLTHNATGRVWIASDNWATSSRVLERRNLSDVGTIVGVTLKSADTTRFQTYLDNLDPDPAAHSHNTILRQYLWSEGKGLTQPELGAALKRKIYPYAVFSVGLAVRAIASALANLCANRDCRGGNNFESWELKHALRTATFEIDGDSYRFNEHGDINSGYDLVLWRDQDGELDVHDIVAKYNISSRKLYFVGNGDKKVFSKTPGYRKVSQDEGPVCCFKCTKCSNNTYNNGTDAEDCMKCEDGQWSEEGSTRCLDKTIVFFGWKENFAIVLLSFAALGVLLTLVVLVLFLARWTTPVVKSSVGPISLLLLFSLLGTFVSAVLFVGKPNDAQCQTRQVLFGLSFTVCVSCILVKSLKILLAFQIVPSVKQILKRLYQPYLIIAFCVCKQVVICTVWLILNPPRAEGEQLDHDKIILQCNEGSFLFFGLMLAYVGLLSLIGLVIAFKGRKLPNCYNEAKFISFSMVIYLICWVVFGPVYAQAHAGVFLPAVEMIVILISAYTVLCCHFLPKCYIICFKSHSNTREVFRRKLWDFIRRKDDVEGRRKSMSPSVSSDSFQNSTLSGSLSGSEPSLTAEDEKAQLGRMSPIFILPPMLNTVLPQPPESPNSSQNSTLSGSLSGSEPSLTAEDEKAQLGRMSPIFIVPPMLNTVLPQPPESPNSSQNSTLFGSLNGSEPSLTEKDEKAQLGQMSDSTLPQPPESPNSSQNSTLSGSLNGSEPSLTEKDEKAQLGQMSPIFMPDSTLPQPPESPNSSSEPSTPSSEG